MTFFCASDPYAVDRIGLECPALPFPDSILAAGISAVSVAKHYVQHQAYCRNAARLVQDLDDPELDGLTLLEIVRWASRHCDTSGPDDLFSQAGQAWNHAFFWLSLRRSPTPTQLRLMSPDDFKTTALGFAAAVVGYDSFDELQERMIDAVATSFGSQWVWLVLDEGELNIVTTNGADSPVTQAGVLPLLVVDAWEHAFYLQFGFDRATYAKELISKALDWDRADAILRLELGQ